MSTRRRGHRDRDTQTDPDIKLSKSLSWLLRHGAEKSGFTFKDGGFLEVKEVLRLPQFKTYSVEDVKRVVEKNDKQRFALVEDDETGALLIRANQGHSIKVDNLDLEKVEDASSLPVLLHGTFHRCLESIKRDGLSRMNRNHIHFATGEPGDDGIISGMRKSCDILIYINAKKAMEAGIIFLRSANNVILSEGDENGYIKPELFHEIWQRNPRKLLHLT